MTQPPYDQLFIYEINGDARPWVRDLGPAYLGLWLEGESSFLFFSQPADAEVTALVARGRDLSLRERHQMSYGDWQGGQALEPLAVGELFIAPAWVEHTPPPGSRLLRLDPGVVFGNGLHPTTRHCLEFLCELSQEEPLGPVLDLGCGTGILALAAAALGGEPVLAVDLNPLCVETTRRNVELNQLAIQTEEGEAAAFLARPAQTLLANIHWEAMAGLLDRPEDWAGKRNLILSGITRSQVGKLEDRLKTLGFEVRERREADDTWFTLFARASGTRAPRESGRGRCGE